jgi:hypothetical protein
VSNCICIGQEKDPSQSNLPFVQHGTWNGKQHIESFWLCPRCRHQDQDNSGGAFEQPSPWCWELSLRERLAM